MAEEQAAVSRGVPLWRSFRTKFVLTYIILIAAVLVLLNTYPVLVSQDLVFQSKQTFWQSQVATLASALADPKGPDKGSIDKVQNVLGQIGVTDTERLIVTDRAGLVVKDTSETSNCEGQYALIREITTALENGGYDVFRSEYRDGAFRTRAASPIIYRGMVVGSVYIYEYDADQGSLMLGIQQNLSSISVVICVLAILLSLIFSKALTRRIAELLRAVHIVREGEYSHRAAIAGGDELAQLAGEFNALTGRLQTTEDVRRRFVSDASHELKTPLASIRLLTDSILQSEHMDAETTQEFVMDIGEEAERLTRITEKLLALTRMDTAPPAETGPVEVKTVVEKVQRMLRPLAQAAEVQIEIALAEGCIVQATEDDLYQIVFNLMENAVKYNLPGGMVQVSLSLENGAVCLRVEDTGVGIPEADLDRIFDRFYRVDKARSRAAGGTGLGLSIVRDTVRQHGGTVTAERRTPSGSIFEVVFPRWIGEEATQ